MSTEATIDYFTIAEKYFGWILLLWLTRNFSEEPPPAVTRYLFAPILSGTVPNQEHSEGVRQGIFFRWARDENWIVRVKFWEVARPGSNCLNCEICIWATTDSTATGSRAGALSMTCTSPNCPAWIAQWNEKLPNERLVIKNSRSTSRCTVHTRNWELESKVLPLSKDTRGIESRRRGHRFVALFKCRRQHRIRLRVERVRIVLKKSDCMGHAFPNKYYIVRPSSSAAKGADFLYQRKLSLPLKGTPTLDRRNDVITVPWDRVPSVPWQNSSRSINSSGFWAAVYQSLRISCARLSCHNLLLNLYSMHKIVSRTGLAIKSQHSHISEFCSQKSRYNYSDSKSKWNNRKEHNWRSDSRKRWALDIFIWHLKYKANCFIIL